MFCQTLVLRGQDTLFWVCVFAPTNCDRDGLTEIVGVCDCRRTSAEQLQTDILQDFHNLFDSISPLQVPRNAFLHLAQGTKKAGGPAFVPQITAGPVNSGLQTGAPRAALARSGPLTATAFSAAAKCSKLS